MNKINRKKELEKEFYDWKFLQRERVDEKCPYARDRREKHKRNCMCFVKNLNLAPDWEENMGSEYPN